MSIGKIVGFGLILGLITFYWEMFIIYYVKQDVTFIDRRMKYLSIVSVRPVVYNLSIGFFFAIKKVKKKLCP